MTARICVSVFATHIPKLIDRIRRAEHLEADLIEVRLDSLRGSRDLSKLTKSANQPMIAANKPLSDKGSYNGSERERLKILEQAVDAGFEYVDLEATTDKLDTVVSSLRERGAKLIVSQHDHFRTPSQAKLKATLSLLRKHKPDICKIVTTARSPDDNLTILDFLQRNRRSSSVVSFAMGKAGVWSRVLAPFYGSAFTYASLGHGLETAPGQPSISALRAIYGRLDLK